MAQERSEPSTDFGRGVPKSLGQADRGRRDASAAEGAGAGAAALRAGIQDTRDRMGDTIEQIGERLNPQYLLEQTKREIRNATIGRVENMAHETIDRLDDARRSVADAIRANPVPAVMIGLGLGWLIWNTRQARDDVSVGDSNSERGQRASSAAGVVDRTRSRVSGAYEDAMTQAGQLADRAQAAAGELADHARAAAGSSAEQARVQTRRAEAWFHDNPIAVGAGALALGLAAGLSIAVTRKETELMGGTRDQIADKVREAAEEAAPKIQHVAERVLDQAQATAKEAARDEGLAP